MNSIFVLFKFFTDEKSNLIIGQSKTSTNLSDEIEKRRQEAKQRLMMTMQRKKAALANKK